MRRVEIRKPAGGVRAIYACSPDESRSLRRHLPALHALVAHRAPDAWGCVPGRSPTSAARQHAGRAWTLCADLREFFDRCTPAAIQAEIARAGQDPAAEPWAAALGEGTVEGAPRQGLPTSPALANLAAAQMDREIRAWLAARDPRAVYTRYVDDLTVSSDDHAVLDDLRAALPAIVAAHGHEVHPRKWALQSARAGRRVICGVAIDADGTPHATRRLRRQLRAAEHCALGSWQARGLREWALQRMPAEERYRALCSATIGSGSGAGGSGVSPGDPLIAPISEEFVVSGWTSSAEGPTKGSSQAAEDQPSTPLSPIRIVVELSARDRGVCYAVSADAQEAAVYEAATLSLRRVEAVVRTAVAVGPAYRWRVRLGAVVAIGIGGHVVIHHIVVWSDHQKLGTSREQRLVEAALFALEAAGAEFGEPWSSRLAEIHARDLAGVM